ncbi:hypothetical protein Pmar_PMAR021181 [Perkinsus marinus ATCC 50983]|uniref:Uncharacterized protein n=1 Tax=Perkinsus marinus (strain ATCC 50983 / TXsc) TaxID=423536 RepID=C5KM67_PERM5|nr:hypothetical protein Pmar_PMAR021181 [Perkinsus marinus ATCC 50983]EER14428.1 hypothetical protein Pmar_PMAR021181 [Perkinsus marinus ATCC 50983]|eukprot:XP_002782633.1 hypothetical protein Pmar_PMAR021181 [Perkinsus marinus ATCC 50983]
MRSVTEFSHYGRIGFYDAPTLSKRPKRKAPLGHFKPWAIRGRESKRLAPDEQKVVRGINAGE